MERTGSRLWRVELYPKRGMWPTSSFISVNVFLLVFMNKLNKLRGRSFSLTGLLMRSPNEKLFLEDVSQDTSLTHEKAT